MILWVGLVTRARFYILAGGLVAAVLGAIWGAGLIRNLGSGGFADPHSESSRAEQRAEEAVGRQSVDIVMLYRSSGTVDDKAVRESITHTVGAVRADPRVGSALTYYETRDEHMVSRDRKSTYALISLREPDEKLRMRQFEELESRLAAPGLESAAGGRLAFLTETHHLAASDLSRAELVTLPLLLLMLILIFRGVVAALAPVLIAGMAVLGALAALRVLSAFTEVSMFAIHVITILGLGLAVDYALLIVARFREELRQGHNVHTAVGMSVATAGRTVVVSGVTVSLALSSLLLFPQPFLRSVAYGSAVVVALATVTAITVLPALLAVLGHRINTGRVPLPTRRPWPGFWDRAARLVMGRPVIYGGLALSGLLLLAAPFHAVQYGFSDERTLPPGSNSRVVAESIDDHFPDQPGAGILIFTKGAGPEISTILRVPHVTSLHPVAEAGDTRLMGLDVAEGLPSSALRQVVWDIRAVPRPAGTEMLVGGPVAVEADTVAALRHWLPYTALYATLVLLVVLSLAFGSVVVPIKALTLGLASLGAAYGVIVWGFQDGHLSTVLGFTKVGYLEPLQLAMLWPILFGLSTDYEVFLLARIREEWQRTGDNRRAIAAGLARTGPIISSAGTLFVLVALGFAVSSGLILTKVGATGILVALIVDITLVRAMLVPAAMRLLGRFNWWSPWAQQHRPPTYGPTRGETVGAMWHHAEEVAEPVERARFTSSRIG